MDEDLRRQLYATPPPEFVAARNTAVKGLRAEKRRDEAAAVAALRRPGWDDWALNVVAAEHAGTVGAFADAATAVRDAQAAAIEGREGPDVRSSLRELRDSSGELVRLAGEALARVGRQPGSGEINARLSEVATNRVAVEALRTGVLGSEGDGGDELFSGLQPAARSARRRAAPSPKATAPADERPAAVRPPETAADRAAERAESQRRREALTAARREQRTAAKALAKAEAAVESAAGAAERAQRALSEAQRERDDAAAALAAADAAVEHAEADADS